MKRRSILRAGATGVVVASLPRFAIGQPANARILRFVPQADLTVLDPIITTASVTANHARAKCNTLYKGMGYGDVSKICECFAQKFANAYADHPNATEQYEMDLNTASFVACKREVGGGPGH